MSFAVVLATQDRIVVASDSRTWQYRDGVPIGPGPDNARKVDVRGPFCLAMTGSPRLFDAWRRVTPRDDESAPDLGRRVLGAVLPNTQTGRFTFGIVRFGAPVTAYVAKVDLHPNGWPEILQEAASPQLTVPFATTFGWDDAGAAASVLANRLYRGVQARPDEPQMVAMAESAIATAAQHSVKIGGSTHIAVVDAAGSRWVTTAHDPVMAMEATV